MNFTKRCQLYHRSHPALDNFRRAMEQTLAGIPHQHATDLASLITLNFQAFENVSLNGRVCIISQQLLETARFLCQKEDIEDPRLVRN